ncbi:MAG: ATP-dependent DNA helicase RecG [Chloroflexi bacterium]|nr:ATP-dependent DNA helicase RecG [Chloroflexota bacterium]
MIEKRPMDDILDKLARILNQEKKLGYQNRAVLGGLDRFLRNWADEAKARAGLRADVDRVDSVIAQLADYTQKGHEERAQRVNMALGLLGPTQDVVLSSDMAAIPSLPLHDVSQWPPVSGNGDGSSAPHGHGVRERGYGGRARKDAAGMSDKPNRMASRAKPSAGAPRPDSSHPDYSKTTKRTTSVGPEATLRARYEPPGLDSSVSYLQGVGSSQTTRLQRLGIVSIRDLLYLVPRRHVDYSVMKRIRELTVGATESVLGTVWEVKTASARSGMPVTTATVADETGTLQAIWFNQPHIGRTLGTGKQIVLSGRVEENLGRPLFKSPDWEVPEADDLVHTGRLVPIYPLTQGLTQRGLRVLVRRTLNRWLPEILDHLPLQLHRDAELLDLQSALSQIHFPDSQQLLERAQRRLAFDELLSLQLGVLRRKMEWQEDQPGYEMNVNAELLESFVGSLPFRLTKAQERVRDEILADMRQPKPMTRLLQGEVGSGKTAVAAMAILVAWANGFQSVLMAPTEILAEQHYRTISMLMTVCTGEEEALLGTGRGPGVRLLTGSTKKADKDTLRREVAAGGIDVVVGTHALIQEGVAFGRLGLVIVDEQHRFGVMQRAALRQKGRNPHLLVMTATPIPRTLALTLWGDMDISIIDELPPGRQEIKTYLLGPQQRQKAYEFVRKQVHLGRQAFIVCPLVEESERIEAKAATVEFERLRKRVFPDLKLGLLHGKMHASEKDVVLSDFRQHGLDILVCTPVVEVGIDIPNATVMMVEGADRFGLAQLHQFRGRVGRGSDKSYCMLLAESPSAESEERLQVITQTQDGFVLAEEDLRLRGPGEFLGTRQSGLPDLRVAKLSDVSILRQARSIALELLSRDPLLRLPEHKLLAEKVARFWHAEGGPV